MQLISSDVSQNEELILSEAKNKLKNFSLINSAEDEEKGVETTNILPDALEKCQENLTNRPVPPPKPIHLTNSARLLTNVTSKAIKQIGNVSTENSISTAIMLRPKIVIF